MPRSDDTSSTCIFLHVLIASACLCANGEPAAFVQRSASSIQSVGVSSLLSLAAASDFDGATTPLLVEDYGELPPEFPRREDALVAICAVRKACRVTRLLQPDTSDGIATVTKSDMSPVTVGDFAAQALVLHHLHDAFGKDSFIAEESSGALASNAELAKQILESTSELKDLDTLLKSIDLGKSYQSWDKDGRPRRVWCLDPIDGTKGFLRGKQEGGQYCVALALLEDGIATIGILGCPNLPVTATDDDFVWKEGETDENNKSTRGCLFVASKGGGCFQLPLFPNGEKGRILHVTANDGSVMDTRDARFCIGVEKFSDALGQCSGMAKVIHGPNALDEDGEISKSRRMDSQAKYGVIARGGAEFYVRLTKPGYVEWIWDQAAGSVVIEEAGGCMTDVDGNPIDFSLGGKLSEQVRGVLGSNGGLFHEKLLDAYRQQDEATKRQ